MFAIGLSGQMFDELPVWEHLRAAADYGYKGVELRSTHVSPQTPESELAKIRLFLTEHNIKVTGLSCFTGNYGLLSEEECLQAFDVFKQFIKLACYLDAETVRVWPAWQASAAAPKEVWDRAAYWLKKSGQYASRYRKKIVIEMHHGTLCDTPASSLRLIEMIGLKNVGLTFDPVNLYQTPAEHGAQAVYELGANIFNVHVKDIICLDKNSPYVFAYSYYATHIGRFAKVVSPEGLVQERYYAHRRISQGAINWPAILAALQKINYKGYLTVESVAENNRDMPSGRELAKMSYEDIAAVDRKIVQNWKVVSCQEKGFHEVVSSQNTDCKVARIFRLNLNKGDEYVLTSGNLEMNAALIEGAARVEGEAWQENMEKLDSFYVPGGSQVKIKALEKVVFYIGAAPCDGIGKAFFRKYQADLPLGDVHQIHGSGASEREVFFTLDTNIAASRLICGFSWGRDGGWTSWPPHQHEKDLEEVYCYFDMPAPHFGFHVSYLQSGQVNDAAVHVVQSGNMVVAPAGYHPTVASPGTCNTYFWVLAAFSHASRSYDLAQPDPCISKGN